ncbi:hypothetical protein BLAT2472_20209 [Burkholderia latens]
MGLGADSLVGSVGGLRGAHAAIRMPVAAAPHRPEPTGAAHGAWAERGVHGSPFYRALTVTKVHFRANGTVL